MFKSITLTQKYDPDGTASETIDIGLLAESMLFYDEINVIANHAVYRDLLRGCTPSILKECMEAGYLKITYLDSRVGINTRTVGGADETHSTIFMSPVDYVWNEFGHTAISEVLGCSKKGAKRLAREIGRFVEPTLLSDDIRTGALEDFSNGGYIKDAAKLLINRIVPEFELPKDFRFDISREANSFRIETNMDFTELNEVYHRRVSPTHSSVSPGLLLAHLQDARQDWYFASKLSTEIATDSVRSVLYGLKFNDLVQSRLKSSDQIEVFQDFVFDDSRAISEAIASGERSFLDFWRILSKGEKFKAWLRGKDPDLSLVKEYFREVTKESWVDKLPAKGTRWSFFTGLGLLIDSLGGGGAGKAIEIGLSGSDEFLLDKILKGWKPNQFIDTLHRDFVTRPNPLTILPRSTKPGLH